MQQFWPSILINGAVVVLLWGMLWRSYQQRLDLLQSSLDRRVDRDFCNLHHRQLTEDIREIKKNQINMTEALEDIRLALAGKNGIRRARAFSKDPDKEATP